MDRKDFLRSGALVGIGSLLSPSSIITSPQSGKPKKRAKNIIFMVSDGMSAGTLTLADFYLQRQQQRQSHWIQLYREKVIQRHLMETCSLNSLVTDSAAGSAAWGGGVRVNNGSLNVGPNGENHVPILQKFKKAGKKVGVITTVPITHATPAGFCINHHTRREQDKIAEKYLDIEFDLFFGGGDEYLNKAFRKDKRDLYAEFTSRNFQIAKTKAQFNALISNKPALGVFDKNGLPYTVDHNHSTQAKATIPTLAEMSSKAIELLSGHKEGFVIQIEGGRVDWAAHGNDAAGLLFDQIAFDDAIKVVMDFARKDKETLVIITTDHGNANPGLMYGNKADENFARLGRFTASNDVLLNQLSKESTVQDVIRLFETHQHFSMKADHAEELISAYIPLQSKEDYEPRRLPFKRLAEIQEAYTSIGWISMEHSGDHVELASFGPGCELIDGYVQNIELHQIMLKATELA